MTMRDAIILVVVSIVLLIGSLCLLTLSYSYRQEGQAMAKEMGCEYLGKSRTPANVGFFDCDGKIVVKRLK